MLVARALKPRSCMHAYSSLNVARPFNFVRLLNFPFPISCLRFSSSSWNKFSCATGRVAPPTDATIESSLQPAASLYAATTLSQKQKKITAVVEKAVHAALRLATAPSHLSRHVAYLSLSVVSISRDCYVVTIGWDCLGGDFSSADQQHMQVRSQRMIFKFC
jgi:hypothetical protein